MATNQEAVACKTVRQAARCLQKPRTTKSLKESSVKMHQLGWHDVNNMQQTRASGSSIRQLIPISALKRKRPKQRNNNRPSSLLWGSLRRALMVAIHGGEFPPPCVQTPLARPSILAYGPQSQLSNQCLKSSATRLQPHQPLPQPGHPPADEPHRPAADAPPHEVSQNLEGVCAVHSAFPDVTVAGAAHVHGFAGLPRPGPRPSALSLTVARRGRPPS